MLAFANAHVPSYPIRRGVAAFLRRSIVNLGCNVVFRRVFMAKLIIGVIIGVIIVLWALFSLLGWIF
jgi:hypothetical protein